MQKKGKGGNCKKKAGVGGRQKGFVEKPSKQKIHHKKN